MGHIGTHPPGLIVGYALLIRLFEHSPRLTEAVVATEPEIVRECFDVIAVYPDHVAGPLLQTDRAVLWAASILTHVLAIVTLVPLYFLLRRTCSPEASWLAVAFWPTVPALAVFLPASDTLLPCFGITFLLFWLKGWDRRSAVLCALSGIVLWTGLFVSLAMLPSAALAVAMTAWEGWICDRGQRPSAPGTSLLRASGLVRARDIAAGPPALGMGRHPSPRDLVLELIQPCGLLQVVFADVLEVVARQSDRVGGRCRATAHDACRSGVLSGGEKLAKQGRGPALVLCLGVGLPLAVGQELGRGGQALDRPDAVAELARCGRPYMPTRGVG